VRSLILQDWMFIGLAYLAAKHAIADFFLQSKYMYANKGIYGHPGGLLHVLIHAGFSAPLLLILPPPTALYGALVLAAEFVVHYHCDWAKEKIVKGNGWSFDNYNYWRAMGIDQLVHGLTYIAMVRALV
jgi:Protein of unknown function (DUF3307)